MENLKKDEGLLDVMFEQTLFYNQLKKESLEKKILLMIRLITERRG